MSFLPRSCFESDRKRKHFIEAELAFYARRANRAMILAVKRPSQEELNAQNYRTTNNDPLRAPVVKRDSVRDFKLALKAQQKLRIVRHNAR